MGIDRDLTLIVTSYNLRPSLFRSGGLFQELGSKRRQNTEGAGGAGGAIMVRFVPQHTLLPNPKPQTPNSSNTVLEN